MPQAHFIDSIAAFSYSPVARRRGSQVVRQRSAKPLFVGSIPAPASLETVPSMKVTANRAYAKFRRRLADDPHLMRPWRGTVYRVTTLDYPSTAEILRGQGSFLHGGRWNAIGAFRAVYGSTSDLVAVEESRANAEYAGVPFPVRTARLLVTIELNVRKIVDLTDSETLQKLEVATDELGANDWRRVQDQGYESLTQAIGRAIFDCGANGILAPSAKVADGVNTVYFPENFSWTGEAKVWDSEKLDRIHAKK